jgi:hypothetical protein
MKTRLEEALEAADTLRKYGIRPTDYHFHVGENGTRCAFCANPVWNKVHDPHRLGIGEEQPLLTSEPTDTNTDTMDFTDDIASLRGLVTKSKKEG